MSRGLNVVVTGGSGLIGGVLVRRLRRRGHRVDNFDRYRGPLVTCLRRRWFALGRGSRLATAGLRMNALSASLESSLAARGVLRPSGDDIGAPGEVLERRFRGCDAVIHLAALPHPGIAGFTDDDYRRINYDHAINVFDAARAAGVSRFVYASSIAVYGFSLGIGRGTRIERFPISEDNYRPDRPGDNTLYGILKTRVEDYLDAACRAGGGIRCVSMRLGGPGFRVGYPGYLGVSTSVENLVEGFDAVLRWEQAPGFVAFNLVDAVRDPGNTVDPRLFIAIRWGDIPNAMGPRDMAFDTSRLRRLTGWRPIDDGHYLDPRFIGETPAGFTITSAVGADG
ncbi:MAG: NAD(P)-dependent oxidoreductase [Proteobacteria bacterium]|nr:MAG: NAD(P)-dependent oxidoreductase [Pseudomonadota bacterium]